MIKKYNFKILGEWWFGTDISDLYRSLILNSNFYNKKYKYFDRLFEIILMIFKMFFEQKKTKLYTHGFKIN